MSDRIQYKWKGIGKLNIDIVGNSEARLNYNPEEQFKHHVKGKISAIQEAISRLNKSYKDKMVTPFQSVYFNLRIRKKQSKYKKRELGIIIQLRKTLPLEKEGKKCKNLLRGKAKRVSSNCSHRKP